MAAPNSKTTFIDYCLRALGAPVIEINVDDDQVDDRVNEALQFYQTYHSDAIEKVYLKHKVTNSTLTLSASVASNFTVGEIITGGTSGAKALIKTATGTTITYNVLTDFSKVFTTEGITGTDSGATATVSAVAKGDMENGYVTIPELVTDVLSVMPIKDAVSSTNMFDIKYQMHLNDMYSLGFLGSLTEYVMTQQWLSLLDMVIDDGKKSLSFDRHKDQLRIDMDWNVEVDVDNYILIECYRVIDPDSFTEVYNDYFLKRYATALIKRQWGTNLLKFEGMVMPGGVTFNGRQLFDDANEELLKLEEECRLNWEQPVDFYTG
jgi:hypothetical protein|tara:strand:- start:1809 stop:2771 length:963 start_codon:yes stop_codon:yes gene_type:complete